jgi:signal transduction histidine kinase
MPLLYAIPGQMRQVFQNLLSNALKFSRKDIQPVINIDTVLLKDAITGEDVCRITVSDNGIGFDEKYVNKIFTLFQRLNPREAYEGTGIGLAIAKKIIDNHGGTITARSSENNGAQFIITLPMHQAYVTEEDQPEAESHTSKPHTSAQ